MAEGRPEIFLSTSSSKFVCGQSYSLKNRAALSKNRTGDQKTLS